MLLPVLVCLLLWRMARRLGLGRRAAALVAGVICTLIVALSTEALSLVNGITRTGTITAWWLILAGVLVARRWTRAAVARGISKEAEEKLPLWGKALLGGVAVVVAALLLTALVAPPNTWDAMTYHMPRVMHWIQNGNVTHYPTHILRQIHLNPGAEFIILHLQLLWGGDRLANIPQWSAMLGCLFGVSLIAKRLGASRQGQLLAAAFCLTLPMGILQATSAQNDYVAAFWIVCLTWSVFELNGAASRSVRSWNFLFATSLAMALLTKATLFIFAAPICIWYGIILIGKRGRRAAPAFAVVIAIVAVVNAGHAIRNMRVFGSPLGPADEVAMYRNASISPGIVVSNIIRNLALHANIGVSGIQQAAVSSTVTAHSLLGVDPNDPASTIQGTTFEVSPKWNHEDYAGCGLHLLFIVISIIVLAFKRDPFRREALPLVVCCVGAFLLFCIYLRWQPWHSRLHLPLFALASPLVASALSRSKARLVAPAVGLFLLASGIPCLLKNASRPMVGMTSVFRISQLEAGCLGRPESTETYSQVTTAVRRRPCRRIGLLFGADDWEYPFWKLLNSGLTEPYAFDHVQVENASKGLPGGEHLDPRDPQCVTILKSPE